MIRRVPHPLPPRRERERFGIPKGPKRVWLRHRKFVRSHHCVVPGCEATDIHFAHIRSAANSGTGLKPHDRFGVPLCFNHHQEQHQVGQGTFEDRHGLDLLAIAAELVRRSPDVQMRLSLLDEGLLVKATAPSLPRLSDGELKQQVEQKHQLIDLISGLPRFIPICGTVR